MNIFGVQLAGVGASVASLLGLLGFIATCALLFSIARMRHQARVVQLLPEDRRVMFFESLGARYGLTLDGISANAKVRLVQTEMQLRFKKQLIFASLAGSLFVLSFVIAAMLLDRSAPNLELRVRTKADEQVLDYKDEVVELRGDYEARAINPNTLPSIRRNGIRLAKQLHNVADSELNPTRTVIKDEYGGWALLLAARTYGIERPEDRVQRSSVSNEAINRFSSAIAKMEKIAEAQSTGEKFATEDYNWMMGESSDWDRTLYLRAAAFAVASMAGAAYSKEFIRAELSKVSSSFLESYPPENIEELRWALK